jgi:hypothetical protein
MLKWVKMRHGGGFVAHLPAGETLRLFNQPSGVAYLYFWARDSTQLGIRVDGTLCTFDAYGHTSEEAAKKAAELFASSRYPLQAIVAAGAEPC